MNLPRDTIALVVACLGLLLSSCASAPQEKSYTLAQLSPSISAEGIKRFELKIESGLRQRDASAEIDREDPDYDLEHQRRNIDNIIRENALERGHLAVKKAIADTNFCRENYLLLSHQFFLNQLAIQGQCNEPASDDERDQVAAITGIPAWKPLNLRLDHDAH